MKELHIKNFIIFIIGGLGYGMIEIIDRGFTHITMGLLGGLSFLAIHVLNEERRAGNMGAFSIACVCSFFITALEFTAGEYLNGVLKMNIWSYNDLPMNIDGQICLLFTFIWLILARLGIIIDNIIREKIFFEPKFEKPEIELLPESF